MKGFQRQEVLIIDVNKQTARVQKLFDKFSRVYGFDLYLGEFDPADGQDYAQTLTKAKLEVYWKEQVEANRYGGNLKQFVKDYGLEIDEWLIKSGYDFTGVRTIFIKR